MSNNIQGRSVPLDGVILPESLIKAAEERYPTKPTPLTRSEEKPVTGDLNGLASRGRK